MNIIDLFAGCGGLTTGFEQAGFNSVLAVEMDNGAAETYKFNHPNTKVLIEDITKIDKISEYIPNDKIEDGIDGVIGGPSCFAGDTLVLTSRGYIPIKEVQIGDKVISHDNKYHKVINVINQGYKNVVNLRGYAFSGMKVTKDHLFYVREKYFGKDEIKGYPVRKFKEPTWKRLSEIENNLKDYYVASAINQESKLPDWDGIEVNVNQFTKKRLCSLDMSNKTFWYLMGRYIGDGWLYKQRKHNSKRSNKYRKDYRGIEVCCSKKECEYFENKIGNDFKYSKMETKTTYRYTFSSMELGYFASQFGEYAYGKFLPSFIFDLPKEYLKVFIEGYLDSDGTIDKRLNKHKVSSVSEKLIYGITQCIMKVYNVPVDMYLIKNSPTHIIEGRLVSQRDYNLISFKDEVSSSYHAFYEDGQIWYPLKDLVELEEKEEVFDLTVEDSHSFMVNNCIVHNCQGFSLSGNRDPKDPRNSLFMDYLRIVREIKPKFFVMENVQGMFSMKTKTGENVIDLVLSEMDKSGYNVNYELLNAAEFGVPQARKRVIFVGIRKDLEFRKDEVLPKGWLFGEDQITVEQALMDLPQIKACEGEEEQEYSSEPQNDYQKYCRNGSNKVHNHIAMRHTKRLVERFEQIKFGQSVGDVSEQYAQRKRGDATKVSGKSYNQNNYRPYPDRPSPTIPASFQSNFVHPYLNRNYTAREGARLQSFPDTYIFKGKRTNMSWDKDLSQYQQIGNAVPPLLAKAIAENLVKYFDKK